MVTNRVKKSFTNIPDSLKQAIEFVKIIAERQRKINQLKQALKAETEAIKNKYEKEINSLTLDRDTHFNNLFAFAQSNKEKFTKLARSITLSTGTFGWRWTPPAVAIKPGLSEAVIIKRLEKLGLGEQYVRTTKVLNREALLKDRLDLSGLSYEQREEFFAKPKLKRGEGTAKELQTEVVDG